MSYQIEFKWGFAVSADSAKNEPHHECQGCLQQDLWVATIPSGDPGCSVDLCSACLTRIATELKNFVQSVNTVSGASSALKRYPGRNLTVHIDGSVMINGTNRCGCPHKNTQHRTGRGCTVSGCQCPGNEAEGVPSRL